MKTLTWKNLCRVAVAILAIGTAPPAPAALPALIERDQISGDWGGRRTTWSDRGYDFTFEYTGEVFGTSGGTDSGSVYQGLGYGALDIDGEKAFGWSGTTLRLSTLWTHGVSPGKYTGDELTVSNIDAYDGLRLYELYIEKAIGSFNIRMGNLLTDEEFAGTEFGGAFINAAFGQPAFWSANTLNTGPAFNLPGLGVRLRYDFTEAWYAQAGIYDGDTFDDAGGDASVNQHGLHFELGNGQGWTSLYEVGYNEFNLENVQLPVWYRLGAWHHTGDFTKHDNTTAEGNWGVYGAVDKLLIREAGEGMQGLGAFFRAGWSVPDRSRFQWVVDTGLSYRGLIPGRDEDEAAIGFVYGRHARAAADSSHENVVEATYKFQLSPSVYLQPDIQWINRPSGDSSVDDAWAFGLRFGLTI